MTLSILIIDCTDTAYNGQTAPVQALGGIQRCVVGLSSALAQKGFHVAVCNNTPETIEKNNVHWLPKSSATLPAYDIVIACNDACLFDFYAKKSRHKTFLPIVWFHNPVPLGKVIRKGRFTSLLRWRPIGIFLGTEHERTAAKLLPMRQRTIISHGLEDDILGHAHTALDKSRPPVAVYISQAYRGLEDMVKLWKEKIHPALPQANFRIYAANVPKEAEGDGIQIMDRLNRKELILALENARVCLIPGHKDETFCLAAAECLALNIPVITYGTGALKERVQDGANGYIAQDRDDFALKLKEILQNDHQWKKLHKQGLPETNRLGWISIADRWISLFKNNGLPR